MQKCITWLSDRPIFYLLAFEAFERCVSNFEIIIFKLIMLGTYIKISIDIPDNIEQ